MHKYIIRRLLQAIPALLGMTIIVFFVLRLSGDPLVMMFGELLDEMPPEQLERIRVQMGLDRPVGIQYLYFLKDLLQGNFGRSLLYHNQPVLPLVMGRLGATVQLAIASLAVGVLISLPAGIVAAVYRNKWQDFVATVYSIVGQAMPNFWLGMMLILLFSVQLGWLPVSGQGEFKHIIMPAFALGTSMAALQMRLMRSSLLEVLNADYIRTARAKGLGERMTLFKHAVRNALLSYVTVIGLNVAGLLSGSVVTEQVFAWPGMGLLLIRAIDARDMAVVQAVVIFSGLIVMAANLIVDIMYSVIDPRIRYE